MVRKTRDELIEALRIAVGPHAKWQHNRMLGVVEVRDVRDSAGVQFAVKALCKLPAPSAPDTGKERP
jgi:hypothetical protein